MVVGERFTPGMHEDRSRIIPPEIEVVAQQLGPVPREVFNYLSQRFQVSVTGEEIIENGLGIHLAGDWRSNLRVSLSRVRDYLPQNLALYNVWGQNRYLLDRRRIVGSWFVPDYRETIVEEMPEGIRPLVNFCNQVEVRDHKRLTSRLSLTELDLMYRLGFSYPNSVDTISLIEDTWGRGTSGYNRDNLQTVVSRLRGKVRQFGEGECDIALEKGVGYRLARQGL